MAKNISDLMKNISLHVQEAEQTIYRIAKKTVTPRNT